MVSAEKLSDILESLNELGEVRYNNIKFRSLRQEGALPPEFILTSKEVNSIKDNMKRQVENFLRSKLDLEGVPVRVRFSK